MSLSQQEQEDLLVLDVDFLLNQAHNLDASIPSANQGVVLHGSGYSALLFKAKHDANLKLSFSRCSMTRLHTAAAHGKSAYHTFCNMQTAKSSYAVVQI